MSSPDNRSTVHELIQQRERLRGWIGKLDEVGREAPDRVAQRVRGDYQARLESVTEELAGHRGELERDLASRRDDLSAAEERRAAVQDAMEEVRLRHLIGELDDRAWESARPGLEADVTDAQAALERTRAEAEDLERLVREIQSADAAPVPEAAEPEPEPAPAPQAAAAEEPPFAAEPEREPFAEPFRHAEPPIESAPAAPQPQRPADPFGDEFSGGGITDDEDLPWLESLERKTAEWESGTSQDSGLEFLDTLGADRPAQSDAQIAEDDLAFLEELDRAIAGNTPPPPAPPAAGGGKATDLPTQPAGSTPAGRLICKECGAPNEPHAWYCEVCGSEL
jgi:hypothetical protein